MRCVRYCALLLAPALLLTGCSRMLETDYRMVSVHAETTGQPLSDSGTLTASTYAELKDAILRLVRAGSAEGAVRLRNYSGDVENDVQRACISVYREEPVGVYALDFLSQTVTPMLSDYEVQLRLTYRRTPEQIQNMEFLSGPVSLQERLAELLTDYGTSLTFETNYYRESAYDFDAILSRLYYDKPLYAQGIPDISVKIYPDDVADLRRVIEVSLYYPDTLSALRERVALCREAVERVVAEQPDNLTAPELALALYDALAESCEFDWELYQSESDSVQVHASLYDALYTGRALPESFALAFKAVCDAAGLNCRVVIGERLETVEEGITGRRHFWNLLELDGDWYHVDLTSDMMSDSVSYRVFLLDDSRMSPEYTWDTAEYPAADGPLTYEDLFGAVPEDVFSDNTDVEQ